ncbi:abscisic acid receptor PYL8 [Trifolium repens]|nr:abscisic acid receptor PYL8 [Trifolium repens]
MTKRRRLLEMEKTMYYLLPKQLWCSFEQNKDGETLSEVGWVLGHGKAITSSCPFSSTAKLKVWSLMRRFDQRQKYKPFISRCVVRGNLEIGSLREVN